VADRREQVYLGAVWPPRPTVYLAVRCDRLPRPALLGPGLLRYSRTDHRVEQLGVEGLDRAPQRRLVRSHEPAVHPVPAATHQFKDPLRRVGGPLPDRGKRTRPHTTATDAIARIVWTWCRTPRAWRGSRTAAKRANRS